MSEKFDPMRVRWDAQTRQFVQIVADHPIFQGHVSEGFAAKHPQRFLNADGLAALSAQQAGVQEAPSEDAKDIPPLHKDTVRAIVHAWGHAGETHFGLYLRFREAERAALAAATQTEKP